MGIKFIAMAIVTSIQIIVIVDCLDSNSSDFK